MTQTPESPNNRIDRLEATLTRFAELSFQSYRQHDEALNRLEANVNRHDDAIAQLLEATARNSQSINRMEEAIINLTNTVASNNTRITDRLDRLAEQSAVERETMISEIREIWRYLRYEPGNGRSGSENA